MATINTAKAQGVQAVTALIDAFHQRLAASTQSLASSRCLSHADLFALVLQARDACDSPVLRRYSGIRLIELLQDAAVVQPIPLTPAPAKKTVRLYAIGSNPIATIPPAELLQAHVPSGILCYFTAIDLHALSTQPAPHHHIARTAAPKQKTAPSQETPSSDSPLPLGVAEFLVEGVTCYLTRRDSSNLLGTQRRRLNPYCVATVTTLEQTLLDCLHRPHSCGGPSVVFEAWETGLKRTTTEKLLALARRIGDSTLLRRAGYMIEHYGSDTTALPEMKRLTEDFFAADTTPTLLPGIPYEHIDATWGLRTP
ncbi:hypothetical protein XTPLMG728_2461 [Xanthomonas translucens pv. poae]|uniref:AbiEi antitoxin C-terminal domain-containing protein n=1 Tax=Xanthomonas graminis pv. poae TaxID=227946 RepID=A0A0K3A3J1_9XANT|nr:hypothetical protein [Xanthomonas translucens]UKE62276.1 hypothetical protein KM539_01555 [Xanthomonas translucens pv. poae]CTP90125.1 hypothetical protein XTPLMG728_2461 [Xanthomonas translucens pv. poae]